MRRRTGRPRPHRRPLRAAVSRGHVCRRARTRGRPARVPGLAAGRTSPRPRRPARSARRARAERWARGARDVRRRRPRSPGGRVPWASRW